MHFTPRTDLAWSKVLIEKETLSALLSCAYSIDYVGWRATRLWFFTVVRRGNTLLYVTAVHFTPLTDLAWSKVPL